MNLIYTIANEDYFPLLRLFAESLRIFSDVDLCILIPARAETPEIDAFFHRLRPFDFPFTSKFQITNWPNYSLYSKFLYVDPDSIFCGDPAEIFNSIGESMQAPVEIYGDNFGQAFILPWFEGHTDFVVNAGTFACDLERVNMFPELCGYIESNKHRAPFDQPLFNQFWIEKGLLSPELSSFVRFCPAIPYYAKLNRQHDVGKFCVSHFLASRTIFQKYAHMNKYLDEIVGKQ